MIVHMFYGSQGHGRFTGGYIEDKIEFRALTYRDVYDVSVNLRLVKRASSITSRSSEWRDESCPDTWYRLLTAVKEQRR